MEGLDILYRTLEDHEDRLRSLETDRTEMRVDLANIKTGQAELKLMISESNSQLTKLLTKFVDADICGKKNNNKNAWNLVLKIWGALSTIALAIVGFYFGK